MSDATTTKPSWLGGAAKLYERYGPWLALVLASVMQILGHRGIDFAPRAVATIALAWAGAVAIARLIPAQPGGPAWQRLFRTAAVTALVSTFRNVLFFLVPLWFASATFPSENLLFPLVLSALALYSCFPVPYRVHVLERPATRTIWTSVILFAALVPAAATLSASPRASVAVSAAIAILVAGAALTSGAALRERALLVRVLLASGAGAGALVAVTPILPPVPVVCLDAAIGTGVRDRELQGRADTFPAGTSRIYGWFSIGAPQNYRQRIHFQWLREGAPFGRPLVSSTRGGRKQGFRTWSHIKSPAPGRWTVELRTDGGQLICRRGMEVERAAP